MTAKEWAILIDGREYGDHVRSGDEMRWAADGVVVVHGESDDLCELRGAIADEAGAWNGGTLYLHRNGLLNEDECEEEYGSRGLSDAKSQCATIEALWCAEKDGPSWTYHTDIPHETFRIMEDGEVYCIGIVFAVADLPVLDL